jgi:hypothetical protein
MLPDTKAVRLLEDGCRRLGISTSTATALVQFLYVKKIHDDYISSPHKLLRMSPSVMLEQLWHWMLLNTAGEQADSCHSPALATQHSFFKTDGVNIDSHDQVTMLWCLLLGVQLYSRTIHVQYIHTVSAQ